MNTRLKGISTFLIVLLTTVLTVSSAFANSNAGPNIFSTDSAPYGRSYGEWMASWQQWATSIPASAHPLLVDTAPGETGQSGPVWFLGGKFCAVSNQNCGTSNVVRQITIPAGTALFFPIIDGEFSTLETGIKDINGLRQMAYSYANGAKNLSLEIDGINVPNLQNFRVQSTVFGFYLPPDDFFTAVGEGPFTPGDYFPGIDDGYYVMVKPLTAGRQHTIHFHAEQPDYGFVLDITYFVNVQR